MNSGPIWGIVGGIEIQGPLTHMTFDIKKLNCHFSAEVSGFDAGAKMTPELIDFIEDAMAEHAVVVLPDQNITDD